MSLLLEAGAVLASSLDQATTMSQVAQLTVGRFADLCVIDLRDADGSIRDVAVAATDPELPAGLEELRARFPLDPAGGHPVARVLRSGEPLLLAEMSSAHLSSFAQGAEHARFMIAHGYRSAIVAPLLARGRTLGALSILRLGAGEPYAQDDLELACELARRAALALDNARLFTELRRVEQRLEAVLVNLAEAITVVDERGQLMFANQAAADLLGFASPAALIATPPVEIWERFVVRDEHDRELRRELMPSERLFRGERPEPLLVRNIVRATGEERWLNVRVSPVLDPDSGRPLYAVNVLEDITEVKRAERAERFMARASSVLSSSMDYEETLAQVARLAVPRIAEWCAVDLLGEHGQIERVAVHHSDPAMLALAERLDSLYRPALDDPLGVPEVIRSGAPQIHSDFGVEDLARYARDEEHLQLLNAIRASTVIIVPIAGPTATLGAITLVSSRETRRLTHADLALAVRLGRRAGTAVENARLYTERTRIAQTLQEALLPESLPSIPGAELEALYSAAGELNEVGGDFYDVFEAEPDHWLLVIGDVCGKGPRAAGVTALTRHTLRAAAMSGLAPADMLKTLHRALQRQPTGSDLCTVCLVAMRRDRERIALRVALAGHHQPLLLDAAGAVTPIGEPGTLLGVIEPLKIHERDAALRPGETLLLYTDGVPEAGRAEPLGEHGLRALCARHAQRPLRELLHRIEAAARERAHGKLRDDLALLAVRHAGRAAPPGGSADAQPQQAPESAAA